MKLCNNRGSYSYIERNPSCEATPFAPEMWPIKRCGPSSGVEINAFIFRLTLLSGLSSGVASQKGSHCTVLAGECDNHKLTKVLPLDTSNSLSNAPSSSPSSSHLYNRSKKNA